MKHYRVVRRTVGLLLSLPLLGLAASAFAAPMPLDSTASITPSTTTMSCDPIAKTMGVINSSTLMTTAIKYTGGFSCSSGSVSDYTVYTYLEQSKNADGPWTTVGSQVFAGYTSTGKQVTYTLKPPVAGDWYQTDVYFDYTYSDGSSGTAEAVNGSVYAEP